MTSSWYLEDAEPVARDSKYTFYKPSLAVISGLAPGNICKLIFCFSSDNPESPRAERMWVVIDRIDNGKFQGHLDNQPQYIEDLSLGDVIYFEPRHIIDLDIPDEEPSLVEKYKDWCLVTKEIVNGIRTVGYLYREEPMPGESRGSKDSGWRFLAGDEDSAFIRNKETGEFESLQD
jgi:hypothetical protein